MATHRRAPPRRLRRRSAAQICRTASPATTPRRTSCSCFDTCTMSPRPRLHGLSAGSSAAHRRPSWSRPPLYHDAIYDPRPDDNEALSAVLATNDLAEIGWSTERCAAVAAMVVATAGHLGDPAVELRDTGNGATETAMLLDADLAILGAEPGAYQAYVNGVRAEYAPHRTTMSGAAGDRRCCSTSSTVPRCS